MSDIVTCTAVLKRSVDPERLDHLYLMTSDLFLRTIPCREKGRPRSVEGTQWEYEKRGDRLHITPSLLCTDTGFHTAFDWDVRFVVCQEGESAYTKFGELNPDAKNI